MKQRSIVGTWVSEIGLGCMNLSHAYGTPPAETEAIGLLEKALELGVTHFDTAALYGFGNNEKLVGKVLKPHRERIFLASKCGMRGINGKRIIDGSPKAIRETIEQSLLSLQTDVLDLYYLHRWDKSIPIEESVGELSRLVTEGKIKGIGLSEVSAVTLRKAHAEHPISALQAEYSLWTRNPEIACLETCLELGTAFVAFSPLARGFLSGDITDSSGFLDNDIRKNMPRFQSENLSKNLNLLEQLRTIAEEHECTLSQLSLAWLLHQGPHVLPIPGTTQIAHLKENMRASKIVLTPEELIKLEKIFEPSKIAGGRYPVATQLEIDTEEF
ncbi:MULTISPECIES: aldo/keto reductase [Alteromonadaceae]|uniref:aldo/keto reductase n=1 Tax=Alteromonadaceae TaxID=72275 RepID=UPI001C0A0BD7|nr:MULTISPECIES: aldo/keto reductase [Aliiglaciecola]MBU2877105.1 aldo/keto reductase [Aliiglaciecola lipolytica]MDO6710176.1 aldo/keto reductase [Aliiglaciecola sp. 2_MG-2023]MDO6751324.1 aldo/keto reductase [Aliiglaciecola sp. 1_MG-2023]